MAYQIIASGEAFSIRKTTTGTLVTETELVAKAQGYVTNQLAEATFQQFLSIFEAFFFDLLRLWLTAYPQSLGRKTVEFRTILELEDRDAIAGWIVARELNEVRYQQPEGRFAYLDTLVKLGCPAPDEVGRIAEAKATRDLFAHNKGMANKVYESKAGRFARFRDGDRMTISEKYHRDVWELLGKVVADVSGAAIARAA